MAERGLDLGGPVLLPLLFTPYMIVCTNVDTPTENLHFFDFQPTRYTTKYIYIILYLRRRTTGAALYCCIVIYVFRVAALGFDSLFEKGALLRVRPFSLAMVVYRYGPR